MARILITSALPYINGVKHLGNLVGSQLPSDAYARVMRQRGHEVLLICATDEHGTPAELAAAKAGLPVAEYCARMHEVQKALADGFALSFDHFGRSSSARNHALTQHMAGRLAEAGLIEERMERQVYSRADGRFLPDRYIEGTCPNCGYDKARGDQCENCTKQLDPTDLVNPRSAISGSTDLEVRETKHLYLRQSAMRERLRAWIDSKTDWPVLATSIARKWLDDGEGLQDRGITRDLDWGIPVRKGTEPWPGMEGKVFYVWFDAPIEYIAATAEWADATGQDDSAWLRWWREDKGAHDVRYVQFMAKDNIPFHTLSFPVTLMGANFDGAEPWKLVDYIKGFNWLTYQGGKFSTSQGRGVFMDQALEILPADCWRWWLLANAPESSDSDFTWDAFQNGVNKDLADVLGNFVSRVTKFCRSRFGEQVPAGGAWGEAERALVEELRRRLAAYEAHWDALEIRKAAAELRAMWVAGNEYLQRAEPWARFKTDPETAAAAIRFALNLTRLYAIVSRPFIPQTSDRIFAALRLAPETERDWPRDVEAALRALPEGHAFETPPTLFAKITDEQRAELEARFAGVD
ncbi:methionine--tRNA ligase [Oceanicella actignis]|uniref:Methionine--tRNA ligase n=1 Tax=Oceanicella actignis TaxID=1189325 RepID=A0A1M7SFW1_9RHOB|nr:methionine--tRNA ligase [Oceanicella actignis]SET21890.1 methionyl-tRNA synthetase [Oceanicella actignis]SHN57334.1 methionyl-tRNA synthetase [Oceanicella actignis]